MRQKKKAFIAAMVALPITLLLGACDMDVKFRVVNDSSIEKVTTITLSASEAEIMGSMGEQKLTCESLMADSIKEGKGDAKIETLPSDESGGIKCSSTSPEENKNIEVKNNGNEWILTMKGDPSFKDEIDEAMNQMSNMGSKTNITVSVELPTPITEVKGADGKVNGNTVTFDTKKTDFSKTIVVKSGKAGVNLTLILSIVGAVVVIAGVVVFIVIRKKKKPAQKEEDTPENRPEIP